MNENTPEHYKTHGMECIKEMMLVFGKEATLNFCKLNVWKYRYRASAKGGDEDQNKADNYMIIIAGIENGMYDQVMYETLDGRKYVV
nr:MAG TPA: nucelotide kinase [Caudoviricetes sp.]